MVFRGIDAGLRGRLTDFAAASIARAADGQRLNAELADAIEQTSTASIGST
jgi:hypothetical protein